MEDKTKIPTKIISGAMRQLGAETIGRYGKDEWVSCLQAAVRLDELQVKLNKITKGE